MGGIFSAVGSGGGPVIYLLLAGLLAVASALGWAMRLVLQRYDADLSAAEKREQRLIQVNEDLGRTIDRQNDLIRDLTQGGRRRG